MRMMKMRMMKMGMMEMLKLIKNWLKSQKIKDHCHFTRKIRGAAHSICNLKYKVQKNMPIVIHNTGYDTHIQHYELWCSYPEIVIHNAHFIMEQLAKDFKGQFDCIGKNMEKYITFSVPIKNFWWW